MSSSFTPPQSKALAAAPPPPGAAAVEEPSVRGVTVLLLNDYNHAASGKRMLTAFLVCEYIDGERKWTAPMGARKFEPIAAQAAAELDEELHLQIAPAQLREAGRFACERVPFHGGAVQQAVFVARRPGEAGCAAHTRLRFMQARQACVAQGKGHCFLETIGMAHVPVELLLAEAVLASHRVADADGAECELRREFAHLLAHARVLGRAVAVAATAAAAAAATTAAAATAAYAARHAAHDARGL